jgi:hypothetical protein
MPAVMSHLRPHRSDSAPGEHLPGSPDCRIQRDQDADAGDAESGGGEQDRVLAPREAVVEVVDEPGLAGSREGLFVEAGEGEDLPAGQPVVVAAVAGGVGGGLVPGMVVGFADKHGGQAEAEGGEGEAEQERCRAQAVLGGQSAGRCRGGGDGEIAGGLVESHGQAAAGRSNEVDLHDDGGGPGQALVDAEQDVGGDDPPPRGCPDQQQRDRQADQPPGNEDGFAAVPVRQGTGGQVRRGLGDAERDDNSARR